MPFTDEHDSSKEKRERRLTVYKEARRNKIKTLLATNYPGPAGRNFVRSKLVGSLGLEVTLAENKDLTAASRKALKDVVTLASNTNVFYQMLSNSYEMLDLDLCGGLTEDYVKSVESCRSWTLIVLTVSNKCRSRWGKSACPEGVHIQDFITSWCEKNKWGCKLSFSPKPYQRPNKNARVGIPDGRSPWYYTFVITRPKQV